MTANVGPAAGFPPELAATMNGTWVTIGKLLQPPVKVIFDNQGSVSVAISLDGGTTTWRTFSPGEALVLDLRESLGTAANISIREGTTFSGNGASGTFSISYIYAIPRTT